MYNIVLVDIVLDASTFRVEIKLALAVPKSLGVIQVILLSISPITRIVNTLGALENSDLLEIL